MVSSSFGLCFIFVHSIGVNVLFTNVGGLICFIVGNLIISTSISEFFLKGLGFSSWDFFVEGVSITQHIIRILVVLAGHSLQAFPGNDFHNMCS